MSDLLESISMTMASSQLGLCVGLCVALVVDGAFLFDLSFELLFLQFYYINYDLRMLLSTTKIIKY